MKRIVRGRDRKLIIAVACLIVGMSLSLSASVIFSSLYSFGGADGAGLYGGLVEGIDGSFYGTTTEGGTNGGFGTIFRVTPEGKLTSLYSFDLTNGAFPDAGLILASDGNFYGTTEGGGTNGDNGTVFRITPIGQFTSLHSFDYLDGANPEAPLVEGPNGVLYGTTFYGGGGTNGGGNGSVFAITPDGAFTTLHCFTNLVLGGEPEAGLIFGADGDLYGSTTQGGTNSNFGTVFKLTTNRVWTLFCDSFSWDFVHGFSGTQPQSPLVQLSDGSFYGTAFGLDGSGTVFRVESDGSLSVVHDFGYEPTNGLGPYGGLILGPNGSFYGTTQGGGAYGDGTIFQLTTNGMFALVHSFDEDDGWFVKAGLAHGSDGSYYGTTYGGGTNGDFGTIFKLTITSPGMPSFISSTQTNGAITLKWVVQAGQIYQTQCRYDLTSTNWSNFGDPIFAIDDTLTATDLTTNSQRFYRLVPLSE